jgi:hypothetical protein
LHQKGDGRTLSSVRWNRWRLSGEVAARGLAHTGVHQLANGSIIQTKGVIMATAWIARHGVTSDQYQQEFDNLGKQGYRLVEVDG